MTLSEKIHAVAEEVTELQTENSRLRTGWASDLEEMLKFHEALGRSDVVEKIKECLESLK